MATTQQVAQKKVGWGKAFLRFCKDPHSSLMLRFAPAWMLAYLPIDIVDEPIPFFGQVDDVGWLAIAAYVLWRINKYRQPSSG